MRPSRMLLARHGRTAFNLEKRIQGPLLDDPLDAVGREEARALADRLARDQANLVAPEERIAAVYASPMRRASETAREVAARLRLPVTPLAGIIEFSWGVYLGKVEVGDVARAVEAHVARWTAGEIDLAPPKGESPRSAAERAVPALLRLAEAHAGETALVVAHGRINKIVLASLVSRDVARMEDFPQSNTGLTLIERSEAREWSARFVNDTAHLAPLRARIAKGLFEESIE